MKKSETKTPIAVITLLIAVSVTACAAVARPQPAEEFPCAAEAEYLANAIVVYEHAWGFEDPMMDAAADHISDAAEPFLDCRGY